MDKIKFANGASYDCTFLAANPVEEVLFVALDGVTFAEAAAILSDASMTQEITYGSTLYQGYTEILGLSAQPYGIQAALKKA